MRARVCNRKRMKNDISGAEESTEDLKYSGGSKADSVEAPTRLIYCKTVG